MPFYVKKKKNLRSPYEQQRGFKQKVINSISVQRKEESHKSFIDKFPPTISICTGCLHILHAVCERQFMFERVSSETVLVSVQIRFAFHALVHSWK